MARATHRELLVTDENVGENYLKDLGETESTLQFIEPTGLHNLSQGLPLFDIVDVVVFYLSPCSFRVGVLALLKSATLKRQSH